MIKPVIAIDLDGVLCNFDKAFYEISRRKFKKPPKGYVHDEWDFANKKSGLTPQQESIVWNIIRNTRNFWMTLDKLPSTNLLSRRQNEFNLFFITTRIATDGLSVVDQSSEWLYNNYSIRGAYVSVAGNRSKNKGILCNELGIEAIIDDKPENLEDVREECGSAVRLYLQHRPYNDSYNHYKLGVQRVSSVNEFLERVKETSK